MDHFTEDLLRRRMHGLYLSRRCPELLQLSQELLGMHCWFHRNVAFSAVIRGADLTGWKNKLTKTWLYRGTLHGVDYEELPQLLALHAQDAFYYDWLMLTPAQAEKLIEKVIRVMEDGVYSRAEMREIFAYDYDQEVIGRIFSPWGGIFGLMARRGQVAFRSMVSRDFDLISAEPTQSAEEVLPGLLRRYFKAYGPATLADAALFFGFKTLPKVDLSGLEQLEHDGKTYYYTEPDAPMGEIPRVTLLSGFDPLVVSYADRSAVLPKEYRKAVILSSGICLPTVAVDGQVAGIWNLKNKKPTLEFFTPQPKAVRNTAQELVEEICWKTLGQL